VFQTRSLTVTSLAMAAALFALAACSSGSPDADAETSESASNVELRMTLWTSNPDQLALFQSIADDFMAQEPAVTSISFDSLTLDQLDTVLTSGIQAGTPPDLTWLPVESSAQYVQAGALADVAPVLKEAEGYDFDDLIPSLNERWQDGDALHGVPFSTGALVLFYNKDLYAEAGVKSPEDLIAEGNWTWESFRDISRQLHDELDVPGYVVNDFDYKNWTRLLPILYAYGAEPWNEDATQCTANSQEFADAIQLFHDMVFTDGSAPVPGQQADFWGGQAGATTAFLSSNALLQDAQF
jgi:multiple sugar transport system substrate-binding protein